MSTGRDAVAIRPLTSAADLRACVALQDATWGPRFSERVPYAVLWFSLRIGGVLLGAFRRDDLIGFVYGMTGYQDGRPLHWSDMLAVRADARDHGLGVQLKAAQRRVLLERGVPVANWTFDPLESRNGHVNFTRLGALSREYIRDVYGDSDSPLHVGIGTDRLVVEWPLASERVAQRLEGTGAEAATPHDLSALPVINRVRMSDGVPHCDDPDLTLDAPRVGLLIPASIQDVKLHAPELARDWRTCTRAAFEAYLGGGYVVSELVRRDGQVSSYILERNVAV